MWENKRFATGISFNGKTKENFQLLYLGLNATSGTDQNIMFISVALIGIFDVLIGGLKHAK